MIKNTHQYNRTKNHITDFKSQIDSLNAEETMHPLIKEASINSCLNMISELEAEIQEYEEFMTC